MVAVDKCMGLYFNSGFKCFEFSLNSEIFIDKSEVISLLNRIINTSQCFICITRPRRFGKSFTAEMLSAYYSKGVDSSFLFDNLKIAKSDSYKNHLNKYNTIFIDMQQFLSNADKDVSKMLSNLESEIKNELRALYPEQEIAEERKLNQILSDIYSRETEALGKSNGFVFIIDEWDCIMREKQTDADGIKLYLDYLRALFKDRSYVSLAYMTGILPIKKYGTHSALNMFREFSMTEPGEYAPFVGFTEEDVRELCSQFNADFYSMKKWYDGYIFDNDLYLYNPNSVVESLLRKKFLSYWSQTETFESLSRYIDLNMSGLRDDIVSLIAGNEIAVNSATFHNDMTTFNNKDDVLTLLIHLGYLAINPLSNLKGVDNDKVFAVHIPNDEIRKEFKNITKDNQNYPGIYALIEQSLDLLENIWLMNNEKVAQAFDLAHQDHTSLLKYNDENSLSCVISLALYLGTVDTYTVHRELPAGKGFADMVYLPKAGIDKPALLVELKYDKTAETAIDQIKKKNYGRIFRDYTGDVLLVGINYDKDTKEHQCKIERMQKL